MSHGYLQKVIAVEPVGGSRARVQFEDGVGGVVDLRRVTGGFDGAFAPLQDPAFLARVGVNEVGTLGWPNGLEVDPILLYCATRGVRVPNYELEVRRGAGTRPRRLPVAGAQRARKGVAGRKPAARRSRSARKARRAG